MAPRYDLPKAAPAPLRLVQELVNTADSEHGREWLPNSEALADWLRVRDLPGAEATSRPDLERTLELREALRGLLVANNGGSVGPETVRALNARGREAALLLRFDRDGSARLEPAADGVAAAHGRILTAVHDAIADGSWGRLKACRQCRWAFYDYSRNRSAAWCSMQICGNRRKARAYRARRAH